VLTRQTLPHQARDAEQLAGIDRGGYVLRDGGDAPQVILIATGSEVELAVGAADALAGEGIAARVVSMPCAERFAGQPADYRDAVLPPGVTARVAIEAGVSDGWWRWVGAAGAVVGLDRFGASGPAEQLFEHFGFTVANVADTARRVLGKNQ